ncbi:MAG: hypothetical protein IPM16_10910 [Chloroflexi bacterium]|nr:hypothetical protein [Chloroflexota bacterium]
MSENFGAPVPVTPMGAGKEVFEGIVYVIVRDDGWIVHADLAAPPDEVASGETVMLGLLESLEFDAQAAAIPFERNLPVYDVSGVTLDQNFTSDDMLFSLQYPSTWGAATYNMIGAEQQVGAGLSFADPDAGVELNVVVIDVTRNEMGLPLDMDTPQEFMRAAREARSDVIGPGRLIEISEFRIAENDAVSFITQVEDHYTQTVVSL